MIITETPDPIVCGVYLLFKNAELIYVGQSNNAYKRIKEHRTNGREFDYATVMCVPEADCNWVEKALIKSFEPRHNRAHNAQNKKPSAIDLTPTPRPWLIGLGGSKENYPEILSLAEARRYAGETASFLSSRLHGAVTVNTIHSVNLRGKGRVVRKGDIDDWIKKELSEIGMPVEDQKNRKAAP